MEINKTLFVANLLSIYGGLLTENQRKIAEEYYYYDISLSEIAANNGITRQGVNDTVKKVEALLLSYEKKLQILNKNMQLKQNLMRVCDIIASENAKNKVLEIIEMLEV